MSGRYRFVAQLRKRIQLYRHSNTSRNPFLNFFRPKHNPNKLLNEHFMEEINAKQSSVLSHQWVHSASLQNKWNKLKNLWFDARTSGTSLFNSNDIDSDYLSKHLLKDMTDDDYLKSKWIKFTKKKLLRLGNASMKNKIDIYHRGELFFETLWNDIKNAEHQILMETYIMEPDTIAIKTIKLLTDASLRGVSVTLIVDSFGSSNMKVENNEYLNELRRAGAVVLEYNKVKVSRFFEFMFLKQQIPYIFAYRNHKKVIVIDDKYGYTGGMNISGEYCGFDIDPPGINKFRDTHCRLEGDIVWYLKESLFFSVLDINPTLPPTPYASVDDDDDDDTDIDTDVETDDDMEANTDTHVQNVIKRHKIDVEEVRDDILDNGSGSIDRKSVKQRLFPYQMLPGFLRNFNAYKKYKENKEMEYSSGDDDDKLSDTDENILFGRKRIWHERWKKRKRTKRNIYDETYKNRLKILASSPRKSLSEWMTYYEDKQSLRTDGDDGDDSVAMDHAQNKSLLEVSALSNLMDEAKQTKNFYSIKKTEGGTDVDNDLYMQVLESYRDKRFRLIQKALISAIDNAESHIFIMNPYILPPRKLKKRLKNASQRGVDIRVITCDQSDVPWVNMASRHIYDELLSMDNVRLFEYEGDKGNNGDKNDNNGCGDILHAKMCVIDDVFVSLGSFNWDDWSYTKNLEMNLMIVDNNVAKSVHEQFIIDQNRSKEIKIDNVRNDRSVFVKCLYYGAYVASRIANRVL